MGAWNRSELNLNSELTVKGKKRVRFFRELTGVFFGKIEVLGRSSKNGHNTTWRCKCHECGKEFDRLATTLRETTKSCGCVRRQKGKAHVHWRGVGEISGVFLNCCKVNAKRRKILFDLNPEYIWNLYLKQDRKCAISGLPIQFGRHGRDTITASLDRKNSNLPYVEGNVQWVHKHINMMKLDHDQDYFIGLCSLISFNQNKI